MDILLSFFFLIIASVIGITLGLLLGMKSYLKIALLVICIFIPMELYHEFFNTKPDKNNSTNIPIHNSKPNVNFSTNPTGSRPHSTGPNSTGPNSTQPNTIPELTKYATVNPSSSFEMDKPPFDGLEPKELLMRLNYIHYATANPREPIHYLDYKTHADKLLNSDNTKLSTDDPHLLQYTNAFYPQLNKNQIDTKDCLNYGSEKGSCFQNPSLFFNVQNDFNILTKGVSEDNANLIIREDFSNSMSNSINDNPILFTNAPMGNLNKQLDKESNEYINLDDNSMCRNCKLAVCKDDYCSLQNNLFM
jgi:hypothetical protein